MADPEQNGKRRISRSARLPQHGFEAVRPQVQALADLAAPSSKERIAEQLGVAAKGRFNSKLAAAKSYTFIQPAAGSQLQVTERGRAFLGEDAQERLRARREGLMSTNYGPIIYLLRSQEPKEKVIAARLQEDVDVPSSSADATAKILVSASEEAELIGENGRFSASTIEDTHATLESAGELPPEVTRTSTAKPDAATKREAPRSPEEAANGRSTGGREKPAGAGGQSAPLAAAPVQIVVNVDASKLSGQEVAELVQALRTAPRTT